MLQLSISAHLECVVLIKIQSFDTFEPLPNALRNSIVF